MDPYIFEIKVPVTCTISYGDERRQERICLPGDVVRIPILPDDIYSSVIEIYNVRPIVFDGKEV